MKGVIIRDACKSDFKEIVEINKEVVKHTSPMDLKRLIELGLLSSYHKVAEVEGSVGAFLLAMRENRLYQNKNYKWFSSRNSNFLYIDRVVVHAKYSGFKIGTMLYQDIFDYARINNISAINCEYNLIPPNKSSRIFHEKFGFEEVGTQWISNGSKKVSLQSATV